MNSWQRLKNLWRLSEYEPRKLGTEPVTDGTIIAQIVKRPQNTTATFIPRVKKTPIEQVTEVANQSA